MIDPSEPFRATWEASPEFGAGVYKAKVDRAPAVLFIDGLVLAEVKPYRRETANEGPWFWKRLLASGTREELARAVVDAARSVSRDLGAGRGGTALSALS